MNVRKLSVSVPAEVADLIHASAAHEGVSVSAWLADAARQRAAHEQARAQAVAAAEELLAESTALHGPLTAETSAWVAEVMQAAGIGMRAAG